MRDATVAMSREAELENKGTEGLSIHVLQGLSLTATWRGQMTLPQRVSPFCDCPYHYLGSLVCYNAFHSPYFISTGRLPPSPIFCA